MSENILQQQPRAQERIFIPSPYFIKQLLQSTHDGILFITLDGMVTLISESARQIFSLKKEPLFSFWDAFPDEAFGFSMKEALHFGISHKRLYRSYGAKDLEISSAFLYEKESSGLLIIIRDITEKGALQSQILRDEQMKKLGEMVASITHEIRNSLGVMRGYASLLYRDLSNQRSLQEMTEYIIDGAKAMERLVTRILHYARPIQIQPQSLEMGGFIRQFVKFIKGDPAFPKNVQMNVHIPDSPLMAPIDGEAVKSTLLNLIMNAYQAMPLGGVLTISLLKIDSCFSIAISDTGIGMDDEQLKRIFSPFFTTKVAGNGLGLVEVKKIIEAHYGSIAVRSTPSKGTTFTLTLPLQR